MSWQPTRDFIGYGPNPPDPKWPDGARLAINFVVNYEEGSEPSMQDGEGYTETGLTESSTSSQGLNGRDLAGEGMFEYGSRVGFWRIMRAFQERGLPLTVFGCALALERNPLAAEAIAKSGFDVCCHGWRWIRHFQLSEAEEREHIAKAVVSLKETVGERPAGWYCRYGPSVNTRRLLVEEGGFTYDSDYYGEELPFWQTVAGKPHLVVPYSLTTNDGKYAAGMVHADQWFGLVRDAFDVLHHEGARTPKMMSVGMHMRLIGHPGRIAGLWRLLDHIARYRDVWVTRRVDIANHWRATHPYPGHGLNEKGLNE
jgi:peptidoglycan/xylan/chitin deacetylase (PgdA/CDA1 family)